MRRARLRRLMSPGAATSDPATLSDRAERRQLTLLFCDLVNSVDLSTRLDPEDLRDFIASYQRTCTVSVKRFNGYVARFVGDGVLVYFGYPLPSKTVRREPYAPASS